MLFREHKKQQANAQNLRHAYKNKSFKRCMANTLQCSSTWWFTVQQTWNHCKIMLLAKNKSWFIEKISFDTAREDGRQTAQATDTHKALATSVWPCTYHLEHYKTQGDQELYRSWTTIFSQGNSPDESLVRVRKTQKYEMYLCVNTIVICTLQEAKMCQGQ